MIFRYSVPHHLFLVMNGFLVNAFKYPHHKIRGQLFVRSLFGPLLNDLAPPGIL